MPKRMRKRHAATLEAYGFNTSKVARERKRERDNAKRSKRNAR